ncbi:MAG: SMC-Scp complex subunit ScpB [Candidatus Colwellbacteria bacterium]|nr:SMC-Scp complex subunit ScpB [Candidatus Colwellbacteria bacterium]
MRDNLEAKIEAFLFLYGEPVKIEKLSKEFGVKNGEVEEALDTLNRQLKEAADRGLELVIHDGRVQLTTKADLGALMSKIVAEEIDTPLTPASLETLSIIAYLGPCNRSLVDYIRGVNSAFILRSLMVRGLVERKPNPERANTFLYQVSFDFLRHIGITGPEELLDYEKYRELVKSFLSGGRVTNEG